MDPALINTYTMGDCHSFALALMRRLEQISPNRIEEFDFVGVQIFDEYDDDDNIPHVGVRHIPADTVIDIEGLHNSQDWVNSRNTMFYMMRSIIFTRYQAVSLLGTM